MALVERLMGDSSPKIPVHDFFAACNELSVGRLTAAQIKNFLGMDAAAAAEFDALIALAPTGSTALAIANRAMYISGVHSVFILAENKYPTYSTGAEVRAKLGI